MGRAFLAVLLAALFAAPSAGAATFIVNRTDDAPLDGCRENGCTFREAVTESNARFGADVIVVRPGAYELSPLPVTGGVDELVGDLDVVGPVKIFGSGFRTTGILSCSADRGIELHSGNIEIRDLRVAGCVTGGYGGGIATHPTAPGFVRLIDVRLDHNFAGLGGGNFYSGPGFGVAFLRSRISSGTASAESGGGILAEGRLALTGSTLLGNTAPAGRGGNVAASGAFLAVSRSSLLTGTAEGGGGNLYVGGGAGNKTVRDSTLHGGSLTGPGGSGGSIQVVAGSLAVINSTIGGSRSAGAGGGLAAVDGGAVRVLSSTIARNRARRGAGLFVSGAALRVRDTLLAGNKSERGADDCLGRVISLGHNLFERRCPFSRATDIRIARPRIGRFALHGATTTKTYALRRGSPAIDAGSRRCPDRDQRNRPRRGECDIGAFEFQGPRPSRRARS